MAEELIPPTPTVEHLTSIFRRIARGDIRIPAFQRRLVWTESQVIALLESVYRGYPIGSILLWSVRGPVLKDAVFDYPLFPASSPSFPTSYILDGMQRLASLYGVFNYSPGTSDPRLDMWFNLATTTFVHRATLDPADQQFSVPISALLNPRELLRIQGTLIPLDEGGQYLDRLIELQSRFQDYMVPTVTISREDVLSVVEIFQRINNSGTNLDTVDFMRAVTWSNDFDLNGRLDEINAVLEELDFGFDEQTLIKVIGLELGREPLPQTLLTLRDETAQALNDACERALEGLLRVANFLRLRLNVPASEFIPYEGQLLVVYKATMPGQNVDLDQLVRWYWAVGFNESLRGKPDHYVARAVRSVDDLLAGKVRGVEPRLELRPVDLVERRFIQRRALSVTIAALFASRPLRSITSGEEINISSAIYDANAFQHIVPVSVIEEMLKQKVPSARLLANLYVPSFAERAEGLEKDNFAYDVLLNKPAQESLASQFLSERAVELLRQGDIPAFLSERAALMVTAAAELVGGKHEDAG